MTQIPILDWQRHASGADPQGFAADLGRACRDTGFFLLTGHGIPDPLIAEVFSQAETFFARPVAEKAPLDIRRSPHNRGWAAEGSEALDETSGLMDRKEAFNVGLDLPETDPRVLAGEPFRGVNVWPDQPGFRDTMLAYYDAVLALGTALHAAFETDLGIAPGHFAPHFSAPMATLRVLSYPAATEGSASRLRTARRAAGLSGFGRTSIETARAASRSSGERSAVTSTMGRSARIAPRSMSAA